MTNPTELNEGGGAVQQPLNGSANSEIPEESPAKRIKLDEPSSTSDASIDRPRMRGVAPVKKEYLVSVPNSRENAAPPPVADDDAAEAAPRDGQDTGNKGKGKKKEKTGQNTNRKFGRSQDDKPLCPARVLVSEFSPNTCSFGDRCRFEHDIRKYLKEHKREDLTTFDGVCPIWGDKGKCQSGWKCRFVGSHMAERTTEDGKSELYLTEDESRISKVDGEKQVGENGVVNLVPVAEKMSMSKKKYKTPMSDQYVKWIEKVSSELDKNLHKRGEEDPSSRPRGSDDAARQDNRAQYTEPPFLPSEKRRIYFGPETPTLAPLTTQGNLPFRRLCIDLGAQFTYSEMAMSMPLIQGSKSEWALMKAHESELLPPRLNPNQTVVENYDVSRDFKFGAQIAGNKPVPVLKATESLAALCPHLRVIDLNCGCPIDLVYREGSGSALLDNQSKLEKMLRGMNTVSGEIPITVKIRTGTKDNAPTAAKLIERLTLGGYEANEIGQGPAGVAAITLHGRTRQQRYTRTADWQYIAECSALIKNFSKKLDETTDTVKEADSRLSAPSGKPFFLGNGDCFSYEDYNKQIQKSGVDSVMIGRGALIKPWIFEEIEKGQYLDKSASERLSLVEKFAKYGLDVWGSDEHGLGTTRRFLLEWLSFAHRYVPVGLLEHLPPSLQDRPPAYKGRNELENLLASGNYLDWIKITEMFLGPAHKDFKFQPKHKSNSYEIEAEG
ncbi:tRNA-dihydrouridine synthase 3 [Arachnomyces sp. PD_36]|nr:tRNA-dihydrouridine synthase 3 [Arachnomyces sp. PD_36]